ncbi:MAG: (2Fe-2S)-binding protein [Oscillospiraceae bacterium]|nr:(2Fe-2S)-binding protein [Oscillospiraceae bacterium]
MENRVLHHPVLGDMEERKILTFTFNGREVQAYEGETVAAALIAAGIRVFRHSHKLHEPRGVFCSIGHCTDCAMQVDGVENVKTCVTRVKEGMRVVSESLKE